MRKLMLLLLILGFSLLCSADDVNVSSIGTATITYQLNWTVSVENPGAVTRLTLTEPLLENNSDQRILSLQVNRPYSLVEKDGQVWIIMNLSRVNSTELLSVNETALVSYDYRNITTAPPFPYPSGLEMEPDTNLTAPTPEMVAKAQEVTAGSADGLEAIVRLEDFVHNYMTYDLAYAEVTMTGADAFALRKGVCDDFSHIFISMAKSVGIPARYVFGYAYSGEEWGPHAWAEAYVPGYGWLPVDPTFNEMLNLDATHVREGSGERLENLTGVRGTGTAGLAVPKFDMQLPNYSLSIVSSSDFAPFANITMETVQEGRQVNATANVKNMRDSIEFVPLNLIVGPLNVSVPGGNETMLYIKPGETAQKTYVFNMPESEYDIYVFPIIVTTLGGRGGEIYTSPMPEFNMSQLPGNNPPSVQPPTQSPCPLGFSLLGIAMLGILAFGKK